MKKSILLFISVLLVGLLLSCSEDWLESKPKGVADFELFYNADGVNDLLIGAYSNLTGTNAITGRYGEGWASAVSNWIWGSVASDDAYKGSNPGDLSEINQIEGFYCEASNSLVRDHWIFYYDAVSRSNDVLIALKEADDMTDTEKLQVEAEARFLRAHFYFELTMIHGKVPYIDENTEDRNVVRNDHYLWPEIETDLEFAIENLPPNQSDLGRPTSWAAKTFLGKVYLFQYKYSEAKSILEDVYLNGGFTLVPDYLMNYTIADINNSESIFEIQYAVNDGYLHNANMPEGICGPHFAGSSGFFQPSHSLVSAFRVDASGLPLLSDVYSIDDVLPYSPTGEGVLYTDPVDPRLDISIGRPGVPIFDWGIHQGDSWIRNVNNGGPYVNKKNFYYQSERNIYTATIGRRVFCSANNYRKYRLSHVILWLAECETEIGSLHEATLYVNMIRNRAKNSEVVKFNDGTPAANYNIEPYADDFSSKEFARKAIQMETRLEFGMEGNRFFDLVRWEIVGDVMNQYLSIDGSIMGHLADKQFTEGQDEIWPIPLIELDISERYGEDILVQNPGY